MAGRTGRIARGEVTVAARRRGPRSAADRVAGLLKVLPWLMRNRSASIAEMSALFDIAEDDLVDDLMMAAMCGVPPYTPDMLTDVVIDEDRVYVDGSPRFAESLALTPTEAFALSVLADAATEFPGLAEDPRFLSARDKLRAILGEDLADSVDVEIERPALFNEVWDATVEGRKLRIRYWSPSTNETTERTVAPTAVFADRGHWYVVVDDDLRGAVRHLRIDRIRSLEDTGESFVPSESRVAVPTWFSDADELPVAVLRLAPSARWVAETYPCLSAVELDDGTTEVSLRYSSEHWLSRLLLRAGLGVEVVSPEAVRDLRERAARAVLDRYGASNAAT